MGLEQRFNMERNGGMTYLRKEYKLSAPQLLVVNMLVRIDRDGACLPTQETLALETGLIERTVRRALSGLENKGLITRIKHPYRDGRNRLCTGKIHHYGFSEEIQLAYQVGMPDTGQGVLYLEEGPERQIPDNLVPDTGQSGQYIPDNLVPDAGQSGQSEGSKRREEVEGRKEFGAEAPKIFPQGQDQDQHVNGKVSEFMEWQKEVGLVNVNGNTASGNSEQIPDPPPVADSPPKPCVKCGSLESEKHHQWRDLCADERACRDRVRADANKRREEKARLEEQARKTRPKGKALLLQQIEQETGVGLLQ